MSNLNYVQWIQHHKITIFCEDENQRIKLMNLGAKRRIFDRKIWVINCQDQNDLADKLQKLNNDDFMFAGGSAGWNPIDIFVSMREKGLVKGSAVEIVWRGKDQTETRIV